ncbi:hydantoinase B/oxoprolinase family protein [Chelatococcus sp. GCM10030263]|uniref:hydantoinase B/oxoprolinase family protein n=1 Tax=Chelatococcus sp. GCM10030263 TaxID=3273387 RepID=UPI0036189559
MPNLATAATMQNGAERTFDPIAMEVFNNRLLTITEMMAISMMRSSFSPQIKERRDFSVGLFDRRGWLVAQGTHIPVHLGSLLGCVEGLLKRYPLEDIRPGDAFICNDPYVAGGTHLPDISIATPIFFDGALVGFAANIGHHSDVGGAVPGSTAANAKTLFEEGLRIPVMRVARSGLVNEELIELVALNSRLPEERALDLRVQIATNDRGVEATKQLINRMGVAKFEHAVEDVLAYTRRRLKRRIADLAPGKHSFTTFIDDDGLGEGDPVPMAATVFTEDGKLVIDLEGTGKEARGALNVAESALRATVYYCVKTLLDPELMANAGLMDAIDIRAPEGSIVNPRPPAACGARTIACQRLAGAIFGAFQGLVAESTRIASGHDNLPSISFSGRRPDTGEVYVCGESMGGGGGARSDSDGMDGIHVHITNSLNLPTEAFESEYPVLVEEYGLVSGSGGPGRHRGGMGITRQVRALHDGTIFSGRSDRHKHGAPGFEGGWDGGRGRLLRNSGRPDEESLSSKIAHLVLKAGETVRIETPGGGGFGPPAERPIAELARDLRDEIISVAEAEKAYGSEHTKAALAMLADPPS